VTGSASSAQLFEQPGRGSSDLCTGSSTDGFVEHSQCVLTESCNAMATRTLQCRLAVQEALCQAGFEYSDVESSHEELQEPHLAAQIGGAVGDVDAVGGVVARQVLHVAPVLLELRVVAHLRAAVTARLNQKGDMCAI